MHVFEYRTEISLWLRFYFKHNAEQNTTHVPMLIILYFEGEGVFILKKEDDEESIKVVEPRSCFCCLLFLVFTINTCMVVHNIVGNFCDYNSIIYSLLLSF